jgi:hypothetical protein
MHLKLLCVTLLAYSASCEPGAPAAGAPQVGLKPGQNMETFTTKAITGPEKGKSLCYI